MPRFCPLCEANEARKRAWAELQRIREMLAPFVDLPPVSSPKRFSDEGAAIRQGIEHLLTAHWQKFESLLAAAEAVRPFIGGSTQAANTLIELNRATARIAEKLPTLAERNIMNRRGSENRR